MDSLRKPFFLVAMPRMMDSFFSRKVILILEHDDDGAFGFILNSPAASDVTNVGDVQDIKVELKDLEGETLIELKDHVYWGGPVNEDTLWVLHNDKKLGSKDCLVAPNLYLSDDIDVFQRVVESQDSENVSRFFVGASSWGAGQLEAEIRCGSWLMVPFSEELLFDFDKKKPSLFWQEEFWKRVCLHGGCNPLTLVDQGAVDVLN